MKVLGLDVGEKRIGVARADSGTRIAVPVGFVEVNGSEWQEIARIARQNNTNFFVLGLPRSNEGNETAQSAYVRAFARILTEKMPEARVRFQDESLTSVVAEERLKSRRRVYGKGEIDAEAAAIILQDFLEGLDRNAEALTVTRENPEETTPRSPQVSSEGAPEESQGEIKGLVKKEADKMKLKAKKTKHKMKTVTKVVSALIILAILGAVATGVALFIREKRYQEYAEYFAQKEAEMNENSTFNFTIRPGETIYEIKTSLIEVGYSATEVNEAFNANYDFAFLQGRPQGATLEGYLFGETHEFYKSATVKEILEEYLSEMGRVINENNLEAKYAERGLSLYEGITLASVVQSEAGNLTSDMPTVAQIFFSRLDYGIPLGSDVTVSYALDTVDPNRETYGDNQAALGVDSCYNTRINAGLPCGPISNPGLSALLAVAEPTDTAYLYFLTGDDGLMYYSYTEAEHNQNIYSHCQNLCNVSL